MWYAESRLVRRIHYCILPDPNWYAREAREFKGRTCIRLSYSMPFFLNLFVSVFLNRLVASQGFTKSHPPTGFRLPR
jgi:hypothetical protein